MIILDNSHAVLWTWDEPVPLARPSTRNRVEAPASPFAGYRLALAGGLATMLLALLALGVLVVLGLM